MKRFKLTIILFVALSCFGLFESSYAQLPADLFTPPAPTKVEKKFFVDLKNAVRADNKLWIAKHVLYPITVYINGQRQKIRNTNEFLNEYDKIMTKDVCDSILNQSSSTLKKTPQGVMVGDGEVWMKSLILGNNPDGPVVVSIITIDNGM